ncbi:MAG: energy transducer TonB [Prevotella sp.]
MMELKKSPKADLEKGRARRFFIALLLVTVALSVLVHIPLGGDEDDFSEEEIEELTEELDMMEEEKKEDRIPLLPMEPEKKQALKMVETEEPQQAQQEEISEPLPVGNDNLAQAVETDDTEDDMPPVVDANDNPPNFRVVQDLPQFPGGAVAFMKWLTSNLTYPPFAKMRKIQGKVLVQFIVNTDGSISDIKVAKSLEPNCDNEAMRVMRKMPNWKPGIQNDKPCRTMVAVPIVFRL